MIQQSTLETPQWRRDLRLAIRRPSELLKILELDAAALNYAEAANQQFELRVPRSFVSRMEPGNVHDPLLRQVLPIDDELRTAAGFSSDPVADLSSLAAPGVIHKYRNRALLITTGACAVHCRYCFRRHYPYQQEHAGRESFQPALDYIRATPSLSEVLLSGGDPLSLSDNKLAALSDALRKIPHIKRLRIHTRQPVVLPSRVDNQLLSWLSEWGHHAVVVLHINHAQEINHELIHAVAKLKSTGAVLLNQAVLLKGVNDTCKAQVELSEQLFSAGILPYYLNLLDRVDGASHFEVSEQAALQLYQTVKENLSGFLLPRLVRDTGSSSGKTLVA